MKNLRLHFFTFVFAVAIAIYYNHPRHVDWFFRTCVLMLVTVFVCRYYRHQFPGALTLRGRIHYTYQAERCFHCQKKLSIWRRLRLHDYTSTGGNDYCSARCRRRSIQEINSKAVDRLLRYDVPSMEPEDNFYIDPSGKVERRFGMLPGAHVEPIGIPFSDVYEKLPGTFREIVRRNS